MIRSSDDWADLLEIGPLDEGSRGDLAEFLRVRRKQMDDLINTLNRERESGQGLRNIFAAAALTGILAAEKSVEPSPDCGLHHSDLFASMAFDMADKMVQASREES